MSKRIAGLDLSTTTAGYSLLDDGELVKKNYYDFDKSDGWTFTDLWDQFESNVLTEISDADVIVLEAALKKYGGMTSRASIIKLLQFNAVVSHELRKRLGKDSLIHVHPSTAKKAALGRGRVPKGFDGSGKEWVLQEIGERYDIEWPRTRYDNIRSQMEDVADAIVLAKAYNDNPDHVAS
jgi:hypothetical protein